MDYLPVFVLMMAGATVGAAAIIISSVIGPRWRNAMKNQPFECGVPAHSGVKQRVSVRFYLVAILFLLFDVEIVFLVPWSIVYKDYLAVNNAIVWIMSVFFTLLVVGLIYEFRKGALKWD